ncbi:hypothetical protein F2Q70_00044734 [Brassica cretica]|uniref:Pentacotripeptide-repeat region of PRORP domain-containing protein n=1 Tax=Brassica cretica TaxID=69181 RepID=A0A8S9KIV6_BRACR|nr:hypothetical protein F2Q70_00044734 [Brassica cretica]KAF2608412.1 hypothetical protein F2Q68_00045683 [Brassica cretica]
MEDAFKVLEEMKLEGTGPNARTYVIMVICLALKQAIPDDGRKYKVADSAVKMG